MCGSWPTSCKNTYRRSYGKKGVDLRRWKIRLFTAMKLDILAVAVHPDDVELGCSGTLLMEKANGKRTGVVDLTRGELGTRGTAELRAEEAERAAAILQLDVRENLGMADGFFRNDEDASADADPGGPQVSPGDRAGNALEDRHPDHGRAGHLIPGCLFPERVAEGGDDG